MTVACPACAARLAKGSLRCRFCGADARAATSFHLAAHPSLLDVLRPRPDAPPPSPPRAPRRSAEELAERARELFLGP